MEPVWNLPMFSNASLFCTRFMGPIESFSKGLSIPTLCIEEAVFPQCSEMHLYPIINPQMHWTYAWAFSSVSVALFLHVLVPHGGNCKGAIACVSVCAHISRVCMYVCMARGNFSTIIALEGELELNSHYCV